MELEFCIPGDPVSWKAHGGYGKRSFNPRHAERTYFQLHLKRAYPFVHALDIPCRVDYVFRMLCPQSWSQTKKTKMLDQEIHTKRPDLTNLVKFTEDCLKGVVIKDDNLVYSMSARKIYSDLPETIIKVFYDKL